MKYDEYQHLNLERHPDGILLITINRPDVLNATNNRLHWELSRVWNDIDDDPETNVVIITGKGRAFSAGGDLDMIDNMNSNHANISQAMRRSGRHRLQHRSTASKMMISAINGVAVGAGLAVAFMADITIAAENVRITDGHLRLGVAAGDHAVIIWPLLCGMAKAKYYLHDRRFYRWQGSRAYRTGQLVRAGRQLMDKAFEVARKIARGPQQAARLTKRALNNWLKMFGPRSTRRSRWRCWVSSAPISPRASTRSRRSGSRPAFPHLKK